MLPERADDGIVTIDVRDSAMLARLALEQQNEIAKVIAAQPPDANPILMMLLNAQSTTLMLLASIHVTRADSARKSSGIVRPGGFIG